MGDLPSTGAFSAPESEVDDWVWMRNRALSVIVLSLTAAIRAVSVRLHFTGNIHGRTAASENLA